MSNLQKTNTRNRPSSLKNGFMSMENIKFNRLNHENISQQPSTPIVPSSSRNMFTVDRKAPKSLIGSPLPLRSTDGSYSSLFSPMNIQKKLAKGSKLKDIKNLETESSKLQLEKVFGFTIQNNASVAMDPTSGIIAFPAGCVIVGYSAKKNKQFFIHNTVKSPITALAFSKDGKLLATGESGKLPKVRIWNVETRTQISEFNGHNYRVGAIIFSPNSRIVVSVGSQEDMTVNVWEIASNTKMATSRMTSKVNAVAFSETGQFFVTVGVRHVRFWYLDSSRSKSKSTLVLNGRNAILGDFKNNTFNDVGCCSWNSSSGIGQTISSAYSSLNNLSTQTFTYVISQAGQLMQFTEQRCLEKWVELQTPKATCLSVSDSYIMVGCSRGIILVFDTVSLNHLVTFPMPHCLGINVNAGELDEGIKAETTHYPDIIAGKYDYIHSRITYFYNDHSFYVWDIRNIHQPIRIASHLFHSGGVWSVEPGSLPQNHNKGILDVTSFITCSDDETIRFWHLQDSRSKNNRSQTEKLPINCSNAYSKELLWIIYTDPCLKCLRENDRLLVKNLQQSSDSNPAVKHGIRSIKISPDRRHLAAADREGNLRFYSLVTFTELYSILAHDGEILSIDYFQSPSVLDLILFCSSSRDRVIHVMDPSQEYKCIQTIDDHSGAILSAKMVETPLDQEIRLVSCGMDKSILFRILQPDESGQTAQFFLNHHLVGKHSQYDMVIAPNNRYAAVACQDRQVRVYNLVTGKQRKSYRGNTAEDGNLLKCAIDPSGTYLATSGSDKYLHILDFTTGEILTSATGHSEVALGLCFLEDLKHLVSVSNDTCIFVWRLPSQMTLTMQRRLKELGSLNYAHSYDTAPPSTCGTVTPPRMSDDTNIGSSNISICTTASGDNFDSGSPSAFRFSVSALPSWAQKKFSRRDSITFVQVDMLSDFCSGMSTVLEKTEENLIQEEYQKKDDFGTRRMSFIATEKIVRDDDSDNVDEEDSEWFALGRFEGPLELETISQQDSTGDEDDKDEDDDSEGLLDKNVSSYATLREDENSEEKVRRYIIQMNKESIRDNNDDSLCSTMSSPFPAWINDNIDDSVVNTQPLSRNNSLSNSQFSFDDTFNIKNISFDNLKRRTSLTSRYLSSCQSASTIPDVQSKKNLSIPEKSVSEQDDETGYTDMSSVRVDSPVPRARLSTKTMSQSNVSIRTGGLRKTSEQNNRDSKPCAGKLNALNKSISISSVLSRDQLVESRLRSNTFSLMSQRSVETKRKPFDSILSIGNKPMRSKWDDSKKGKIVRKTCPVNIKDIERIQSKHSDVMTVEQSVVKPCDDVLSASVDLSVTDRRKEHVIDEIEDVPTSDGSFTFGESFVASCSEIQDKSNTINLPPPGSVDDLPINEACSDDWKSIERHNSEQCTDEWIDDLFRTRSTEFLATMAPKILSRLVDSPYLDSTSQRRVRAQMLFEVEAVYRQLKSSLNLSQDVANDDTTTSLIRDIGDRIVEEVKRRLSESL